MSAAGAGPLLIVDAANVVGAVSDGWWRNRAGAARRLRAALAPVVTAGLPSAAPGLVPPIEVVLVVEGAARAIADEPEPAAVRVIAATGSADEAIVDLVGAAGSGRACVVVTADRHLRERVAVLGARVLGPRSLPHLRR